MIWRKSKMYKIINVTIHFFKPLKILKNYNKDVLFSLFFFFIWQFFSSFFRFERLGKYTNFFYLINFYFCQTVSFELTFELKFILFKGITNFSTFSLRFWSQKRRGFNRKNSIPLSFWCVVKDMNRNLHIFFYLMKKLFEFVCFQQF